MATTQDENKGGLGKMATGLVAGVVIGALSCFIICSKGDTTATDDTPQDWTGDAQGTDPPRDDTCYIQRLMNDPATIVHVDSSTAAAEIAAFQNANRDTLWAVNVSAGMLKAAVTELLNADYSLSDFGGFRYYLYTPSITGPPGQNRYVYQFPLNNGEQLMTGLPSGYKPQKIAVGDSYFGPCPRLCD